MRREHRDGASPSRRALLGLGAAVLTSGCAGGGERAGGRSSAAAPRLLDAEAFASELERGDRWLLNVHVPDDGSLPGTDRAVAFDQLPERRDELPAQGTALAVYCRTGSMSAQAVPVLVRLGYDDVVELDGGMVAWQEAGRPLLPQGSVEGYVEGYQDQEGGS